MTKVVVSNGAANTWVGEKFSPLLVEQIAVMLEKEEKNYACLDYISVPSSSTDLIDEKWRQKAAEWMFKVVDFYDLERDIVSIGMMYLDRLFTETDLSQRWTRLQCRLVASKSHLLLVSIPMLLCTAFCCTLTNQRLLHCIVSQWHRSSLQSS